MRYHYLCPACGEFESPISGDLAQCRCGSPARRLRSFAVNRSSLRSESRWDPVVGQYVANNREFEYALRKGQEAESEKLNMEVKLATVDARDHDALASLHGHDAGERKEMAAKTKFEVSK